MLFCCYFPPPAPPSESFANLAFKSVHNFSNVPDNFGHDFLFLFDFKSIGGCKIYDGDIAEIHIRIYTIQTKLLQNFIYKKGFLVKKKSFFPKDFFKISFSFFLFIFSIFLAIYLFIHYYSFLYTCTCTCTCTCIFIFFENLT